LVPASVAQAGEDTPEAVIEDIRKVVREMKSVLEGIRDRKTAEAARANLIGVSKRFAQIRDRAAALKKDPALRDRLKELEGKYDKEGRALAQAIFKEMERVAALPGGADALKDFLPYQEDLEGSRRVKASLELHNLTAAVEAYKDKHGAYPPTLKALTEKQPDGGKPVLDPKSLLDPWGREYVYDPSMQHPTRGTPLIYSQGPRPGEAAGRIRNWTAPTKKE
jgi:hypothetical protein